MTQRPLCPGGIPSRIVVLWLFAPMCLFICVVVVVVGFFLIQLFSRKGEGKCWIQVIKRKQVSTIEKRGRTIETLHPHFKATERGKSASQRSTKHFNYEKVKLRVCVLSNRPSFI